MKLVNVIKKRALPSFCTSNGDILNLLIKFCKINNLPLLIESTSNQVNQFGGYSKQTPKIFFRNIQKIVKKEKFNPNKIYVGGDHLGPLPWKDTFSSQAIKNSLRLVRSCIQARYQKIHIDTSIKCKDDKVFDNKIIYNRAAYIFKNLKKKNKVFFVFGTEVPLSGGNDQSKIKLTSSRQIKDECKNFKKLIKKRKKILFGLVIEPGMKFMKKKILKPQFKDFKSKFEISKKNNFVYEAHSTDYQSFRTLKKLVKYNFKFLKVGPELTYNLLKSFLFMENLEKDFKKKKSNFKLILKRELVKNNKYWLSYHNNKNNKLIFNQVLTSKFNRTRYYLDNNNILKSLDILKKNINSLKKDKIEKIIFLKNKKTISKNIEKFSLNNFEKINFYFLKKVFQKYYSACGFSVKY